MTENHFVMPRSDPPRKPDWYILPQFSPGHYFGVFSSLCVFTVIWAGSVTWYVTCVKAFKFSLDQWMIAMNETEQPQGELPDELPVSIIMESRPSNSQWVNETWQAVGVTVGSHHDEAGNEPRKVYDEQGVRRYLHAGLKLKLYVDECESYYHNLVSPLPRCYVITEVEDDQQPRPLIVSMSFDEAHAYLEGDDEIFAVDIPPEVYVWTEAFVISNYFPEKKIKRKLNNWKGSGKGYFS